MRDVDVELGPKLAFDFDIQDTNEFTVRQMPTGDLAYFMDFYTSNPARYYPTPFVTGYRPVVRTVPGPGPVPQTETHLEPTSEVTYVEVDAEAGGRSPSSA